MKPDTNKLTQLVLYLCLRSEADPFFGLTKLYKLIFYCDFSAYRRFGESITGQKYRALPYGSVPDKMDQFMNRLKHKNWLVIRNEKFYGYAQKRPLALREPDIAAFEVKQLDLIHSILDRFRQSSGSQMSEASHQFLGWDLAELGEMVPYSVAVLDRGELTERERVHANKIEKRAAQWLGMRAPIAVSAPTATNVPARRLPAPARSSRAA